jgi:hypothetical protein
MQHLREDCARCSSAAGNSPLGSEYRAKDRHDKNDAVDLEVLVLSMNTVGLGRKRDTELRYRIVRPLRPPS